MKRWSQLPFLRFVVSIIILGAIGAVISINQQSSLDKTSPSARNSSSVEPIKSPVGTKQSEGTITQQNPTTSAPTDSSQKPRVDCVQENEYETNLLNNFASSDYQTYLSTKSAYLNPPQSVTSTTQQYIDKAYKLYTDSLSSNYFNYVAHMAEFGCSATSAKIPPQPE